MEKRVKISSELSSLRNIEQFIEEAGREFSLDKETFGKVLVSVMEAANNAIIHGNREDSSKYVLIVFGREGDTLNILIEDEGSGFIPDRIPDPTTPENRENIRGRGVFLMRRLSDKLVFNERGNVVRMSFNIPGS